MKYNTKKLSSGLRIIHMPSVSPVVYCGYQLAVGSRDEGVGEEGLAHFTEHMTFKGTDRRNAIQIINALECLGGDLNAYTNKESTVFYAAVQKEHLRVAVDLLTDVVFHSTYPQTEIDREVEVVCDEIESYNDSPAELIYDEFEDLLFEGHPLGHNILGQAERLRSYTTVDFRRFADRYYLPQNAVFFVYGDVNFQRLCNTLESLLPESAARSLPKEEIAATSNDNVGAGQYGSIAEEPTGGTPQTVERTRGTHQAHLMIGTRAYGADHPRRLTLFLLNNILGGPAMNARLNLSLRERNGLVYTVESSMVAYGDVGVWSVYFGCDPHDVSRCRRLVRQELDKLMEKPLSPTALSAAKQQLKGQLAIACDSREQFALDFGKIYLFEGKERHIDELFRRIDAITADDLRQVACELFPPGRLTTLIYK